MKLSSLTSFGFYINGALGSGKYNDISIPDVKTQLNKKSLFTFLEEKLEKDIDTSHFSDEDKKILAEEWLDMALSIDESRKLCVEKSGLALITAYIFESIQRIDHRIQAQNKAQEYLNSGIAKYNFTDYNGAIQDFNKAVEINLTSYNAKNNLVFVQEKQTNNSRANQDISIVKIGNQEWMVKNLNVDRFRNGDLIPEAKTDEDWDEAAENGRPIWSYYENDSENEEKYGKLYNWYAVCDPRGLAPIDFHIPTKPEFEILKAEVKSDGNALKAIDEEMDEDEEATNTSGFSALLAGNHESFFYDQGQEAYFWSSSETNTTAARTLQLSAYKSLIKFINKDKGRGCSVRCIKD